MQVLVSSVVQFLWFGSFCGLMVIGGTTPAPLVVALFTLGVMGSTSLLCTLIVAHFERGELPHWLLQLVLGFIVSHVAILTFLPAAPAQSALAWMDLVLRTGLAVATCAAAGVLCKPYIQYRFRPIVGSRAGRSL